jgi:hypothetical protein
VRGWFCARGIPDLVSVNGFKELIWSKAPYIVAGGTWQEMSGAFF